tara:strand:- start:1330 stop:3504 length:2175 start_codon:yes stop_codon:yes gene_type:complete
MSGGAHTDSVVTSVVDARIISEIFKCDTANTLIWNGYKPDGTKNQYWKKQTIDWDGHIQGTLKQGGCLNRNGVANCAVIDVDKKVDPVEFCRAAYAIDPLIIPFRSPSGTKWHAWKFYHKDLPVAQVAAEAKKIEKEFKKIYGKDVDVDKTQPTVTGQIGINFPFSSKEQYPYSPQGNKLSFKQFTFKYRFQHHPLIAIAAGLTEPGRHKTLLLIASYLHQKNKMKFLDEVIGAMDGLNDEYYRNRILNKNIHEKYKVGAKAIQKRIAEIVGHEDVTEEKEYIAPVDEPTEDIINEPLQPLEIFEHTGLEPIQTRPWLMHGMLLENALTLVVGQPGVGKTMLLHMLGYSLATGNDFFGKQVEVRGNVLGLFAEETSNESAIRWAACKQKLGKNDGKYKLFRRGLEHELKLVKFSKDEARATTQYRQLELAIKENNIKYIIVDPLISFQSGNYDENSNSNMEAYVKNYIVPLALKMGGAVIAGHHTNKLSMVASHDNELLVDNQNALMGARGASSLIGAARFVVALQPMTKKLWDQYFAEHITDGSTFIHYTGLIEAKSNYNMIADDIMWLKKETVDVPTDNGTYEATGIYATTELNKVTKAKNKLKAAKNLAWCRSQLPHIQKLFSKAGDDADSITLNSIVTELVPMEDDFGDENVLEAKIKTRVRRKLENGFSGKAETKDGYQMEGIEADDGYNYWIKRDYGSKGAAKVFLTRYIDFKRKNAK